MAKTVAGALVGKALGAYGKKPVIPELAVIDPSQIQTDTTAGNQAVLPAANALAQAVNASNADQFALILDRLFPGQRDAANAIVKSELRGEVPADVRSRLENYTNAQAASLGLGGSQFQVGLTGGRFLQTSQDIQNRGLQHYGQLASTAPRQFDVTSMFFSPQQRLSFAMSDRTQRFQRDLLAAQVAAAPNPEDVALAEGFDNFFEFWKNIGGMALGNMGGMGGGGGSGGGGGMTGAGGGGSYIPARASYSSMGYSPALSNDWFGTDWGSGGGGNYGY